MSDSDVVGFFLFWFGCWIMWIVLGGLCGHFRGRPGSGMVWGLLFGPIGIAIILWVLDDLRPHCTACTKAIPAGAIRCPYCGSQQSQVAVWKQSNQDVISPVLLVCACLFAFIGLVCAFGALASGGILAGSVIILLCVLAVGGALVNLYVSRSKNRIRDVNLYASRSKNRIGRPVQPVGAELVSEHQPRSFDASKSPERQPPPPPPASHPSTTDKISVGCPCGARFVVPAAWVGKQARCRECGTVFAVEQSLKPLPLRDANTAFDAVIDEALEKKMTPK